MSDRIAKGQGAWRAGLVADRALIGLLVARSFVSAGFALVSVASPELLFDINGREPKRAERVRATVETINTVAGFLVRPTIGGLIDAYGRRAGLVLGPAASAAARLIAAVRPTNATYILYRVLNLLSLIPLMQAYTAVLADRFGGRGSRRFVRFSKLTSMWLALVRLATLSLSSRIRSSKQCFVLAAGCNAAAAAVFAATVRETLAPANRRPFRWKRAANPFSFVPFFAQSIPLMALAGITLVRAAPTYNGVETNYVRQKFGWGRREAARRQQLGNVLEVVAPLYSVPIMAWLGPRLTARLHHVAQAGACLNLAATPDSRTIYLNPIVCSLFDEAAFDRLQHDAAATTNAPVGQGELSAALMNLRFPLGLLLPTWFSTLFGQSMAWKQLRGGAPFLVAACLHAAVASAGVPLAWNLIQPRRQTTGGVANAAAAAAK